ncbi:hypothetical protein B0H13DRAFT_1879021 [Mycena leptocephala]|nr:hypothetical protein B0H13DRAFT_1879021 [Mycena leptocephala]
MIRHWEESNDGCVWCMRGGSAVLADRDFPGCEEGSGEERIGAERNAGGAEPVHKGHQGSEGKRPEATQPERSSKSRRLTRGVREAGPRAPQKSGVKGKKKKERKKEFLLECMNEKSQTTRWAGPEELRQKVDLGVRGNVNRQVAQDSKEQAEMGKAEAGLKAGGGRKGERGEARGMRETELSKAREEWSAWKGKKGKEDEGLSCRQI